MNVSELLATLKAKNIQLALTDDQLRVNGNKQALGDQALLASLREHKPALIELIKAGHYSAIKTGRVEVPANGIGPGTTRITPAMLTLIDLDQDTLDRLVADVPGGAGNVQDIYPLAPLQEGILYHHISAEQGDPYVLQAQFAFADSERLKAFAQALQRVIDRHDILRTAVVWEGLDTPLQVVLREAQLPLEEVALDITEGDALAQLHARFDARHLRLDVTRAPLLRLVHAWDEAGQRIVAILLFHHLALDHSALAVASQEMQACLSGRSAQLGRPVPFRNYVAQARLGISEAEHEGFFRDMLGDIDEPTLPFDLQDVQGDGNSIAEFGLPISLQLSQRLRTLARQLGVSAASLFHLGWAQVLSVLTGKSQVVFGTVLMGRMQGTEATERALGIFINTLPLRVDVGAQGVCAAVKATHARLTTLMRHEHAPLALAQRCSGVVAPTPLFSTLLNYRHSPSTASVEALTAWDGIDVLRSEERTNYPLALSVDDLGEAFSLTLLAAIEVEPQRICYYLLCAMEHLVLALEQAPDKPLNQLPILPVAEREQVLVGFNTTHTHCPRGLTIHQRFEAQVAERPEAVAAVFLGEQLTYTELNRHANALAHHLCGLGVKPDDRVAIVARRGLDTLVGLLAILKAGAGYVPVDPAHPAERLSYLLSDSDPVAVLTQHDLRERLPTLVVPVIDLDRRTWPLSMTHGPQVSGLTPEHLAYVIYTSGSTGLPKGVMVEHHTLSNLLDWHCEAFDVCAGRHTSSLAGFGFDAMAWEVWPALCAGATLHLAPTQDGSEDIDALLDWWRAQPLDVSFLPTPVAEYAFSQNLTHPTLRTLLIGGDRLRQFSRNQPFDVINNYGPTEATVVATSGRVEAGEPLHIGRPVSNAKVYVLDEQQRPVPIGVSGELYVGGAGVARGYLNRPELTAERFLRDPFSAVPNPRMYRTGDLARWRADGTLDYLGRNDDQVKIRGVRIELGEIETCLNQLPGIQETVLLAREDQPGQPRLVAYFTEQAQVQALSVGELRAQLLTRLPEYMVPVAFVKLDALPLTANGKVDRKALPEPDLAAVFTRQYVAPEGKLEAALAQIWAEVLQVERVGRHDSFFELGGHSLLAIRLVNLMRHAGLEMTLAELFQHVSIESAAGLLGQRNGVPKQEEGLVVVRAASSGVPLFLVHEFNGMDLYFPALGMHIEGEFPIYGLPGIPFGQPLLRTMECLATRMVGLIRSVQPHGPYRLAGWSFGGVLAYEIAMQLLGMDEPVAFIGLIDSYVPRLVSQSPAYWNDEQVHKRQLLLHCTVHWMARGADGQAALIRLASLEAELVRMDFDDLLRYCHQHQLLDPELAAVTPADAWHYLAREVAHGHALTHYRINPINLPVHLFRAQERPPEMSRLSPSLGWAEELPAGWLRCIDVPGDHRSMMTAPHIQSLGWALSQALREAVAPKPVVYQPLLTIQSGHTGHAPIFCVPGAGDSVTGFIHLTEALGPQWPIFGLQPRGLDGEAVPHSQVESAAACYVQAIEQLYPNGPVHLIGHSFGGWVAYAMAAQLQAVGRDVASLTLIDSESPGGNGVVGKPYTTVAALQRLIEALQLSCGKSLGIDPLTFAEADDAMQMRLLHAGMVRAGVLSERSSSQAMHGPARTFATALRTVYQPRQAYTGPVRLVLVDDLTLDASGNQREQAAMLEGWRRHVTDLTVWYGQGNHFTVLKAPNVFSVAAWWHDGLQVTAGKVLS